MIMKDVAVCEVISSALESMKQNNNLFKYNDFLWEVKENNDSYEIKIIDEPFVDVPSLLSGIGLAKSKSDAKRLIISGAVYIDGIKITNFKNLIKESELVNKIIKVGRKYKKIIKKQ